MKGKMAVLVIFCVLISGCFAANEERVSSAMIRIADTITCITFTDNVIVQYEDGSILLECEVDGEALYMMSEINGN